MTEPEKKPRRPGVFSRLKVPANLNYLILTAGGLLVYFLVMAGRGNETGALLCILIAVPGVLARWVISPAIVLLMTTYLMIDPGFMNVFGMIGGGRWFTSRSSGGFDIEDVLLAASLLAYVIGHFRLTALVHQGMPADPGLRGERESPLPARRNTELVPADELPKLLFVGAACVVGGQVAWLILSFTERASRPNVFNPGVARLFTVIWIVGVSLMLVSAALIYLRSARMTAREASLSLRDAHFQELRRETDRLQRWRKWFKEKMARRRRAGK